MPSKKKKYNARFPPARIKKIMQTDEEVGKVAAAVPVIISRALELFIESLILKTNETTQSRSAKTLSTAHIKQTILAEKNFDFLKDLVANIPDVKQEDEQDEEFDSQPGPSHGEPARPRSRGQQRASVSEHDGPRPRGRPRKKKEGEEHDAPQSKKRGRRRASEVESPPSEIQQPQKRGRRVPSEEFSSEETEDADTDIGENSSEEDENEEERHSTVGSLTAAQGTSSTSSADSHADPNAPSPSSRAHPSSSSCEGGVGEVSPDRLGGTVFGNAAPLGSPASQRNIPSFSAGQPQVKPTGLAEVPLGSNPNLPAASTFPDSITESGALDLSAPKRNLLGGPASFSGGNYSAAREGTGNAFSDAMRNGRVDDCSKLHTTNCRDTRIGGSIDNDMGRLPHTQSSSTGDTLPAGSQGPVRAPMMPAYVPPGLHSMPPHLTYPLTSPPRLGYGMTDPHLPPSHLHPFMLPPRTMGSGLNHFGPGRHMPPFAHLPHKPPSAFYTDTLNDQTASSSSSAAAAAAASKHQQAAADNDDDYDT